MTTKTPSGTGLAADDSAESIEDILMTATPGPVLKTPGPTKTPGPVAAANRDPSSALPTIPPPTKEPSGAFPLPGMAPPEANKGSDEDVTLIARLSVLDEVSDESTKVEPLEAALRAKASTEDEPVNLGLQAATQRDKALSMAAPTALDRISAAEFEDPGDDDDDAMTVSATPGIISIEEDDEEPTASQRPPGAGRATPGPVIPNLVGPATPAPLAMAPRLPAPTPVPGRALHLPTPNGGMPVLPPLPGAGSASGPSRVPTPSFPIPAPLGSPAAAAPGRSAVFKSVQVPLGGIVACLVAVFGLGFVVGAYLWQGEAPPQVAAEAPPRAPAELPARTQPVPAPPAAVAEPAPAPSPAAAAPTENPAPEKPAAATAEAVEPKPAQPIPAAAPKAEPDTTKLVNHVPAAKARVVRKPAATVASAAPAASPKPAPEKPVAAKPAPEKPVAAKPAPEKPAAAKPASVASTKPKAEKARGKGWVDPFAE